MLSNVNHIHKFSNQLHCIYWNIARLQHNQLMTQPSTVILYKKKSIDYLKSKAKDAYSWYEHFTGLYDVRLAQNRVLEATQMLREAQEKRRDARLPLSDVQKRLQNFLPELRNTPRGSDRYLELLKEEHECVKEVQYLQAQLQQAEIEERESFELLSSSLRSSHETERAQAERTKYWSLIASIIGTVIGVVGSTLNNNYKMREFKTVILETNRTMYIREMINYLEEYAERNSVKQELSKIYNVLQSKMTEAPQPIVKDVDEQVIDNASVLLERERSQTRWLLLVSFGLGYVFFKALS